MRREDSYAEPLSRFQTTCWSEVLDAARHADPSPSAAESLATLCRRYWYPLYAFLRRRGHSAATAEDYVQGFFAELLDRDTLRRADPARGRFRSFLLTACKNYVANEMRRERSLRRGGNRVHFSLTPGDGERRYLHEPAATGTPEQWFDRQWAVETIEAALQRLAERYAAKGRAERFEALRLLLAPAESPVSMAEVANRLGVSEGAAKVAAHRLRKEFAALLRDAVADTLDLRGEASAAEDGVDAELAVLLAALRG